jgi:hypothetical protein
MINAYAIGQEEYLNHPYEAISTRGRGKKKALDAD